MKKTFNIITFILITVILTNCTSSRLTSKFDYGDVKDNVYKNSYFNCEMTFPDDWVFQSKESIDRLSAASANLAAGDNEDLKNLIDAADISSAFLLVANQFEMGSPVMDFNSSITLVAENLSTAPGIKNGSDYLFHCRKLMNQTQMNYENISTEDEKILINGKEFYKMETTMKYMGYEIKQEYYASIIKGFAFSFIITYVTDEQGEVLYEIVNSLKFEE